MTLTLQFLSCSLINSLNFFNCKSHWLQIYTFNADLTNNCSIWVQFLINWLDFAIWKLKIHEINLAMFILFYNTVYEFTLLQKSWTLGLYFECRFDKHPLYMITRFSKFARFRYVENQKYMRLTLQCLSCSLIDSMNLLYCKNHEPQTYIFNADLTNNRSIWV